VSSRGDEEEPTEEEATEHLLSMCLAGPVVGSVIGDALRWLEALFASHGYLIMAVLIGGESAGLPLPGETSLLAGAVEAQRGVLYLPWVITVAAAAAMIGDNVGYWVGRRVGRPTLLRYGRFVHMRDRQIRVLDYFYAQHGAKTVFFGRWITILRVGAAVFAGASRMPWRSFLLWNALGSVAWAVSVALMGFFFWASIGALKGVFGYVGAAALVATMVGGFFVWRRTEKRLFENAEREQGEGGADKGRESRHSQLS
jgi:membrane protein DedA with SNARE-associated domain